MSAAALRNCRSRTMDRHGIQCRRTMKQTAIPQFCCTESMVTRSSWFRCSGMKCRIESIDKFLRFFPDCHTVRETFTSYGVPSITSLLRHCGILCRCSGTLFRIESDPNQTVHPICSLCGTDGTMDRSGAAVCCIMPRGTKFRRSVVPSVPQCVNVCLTTAFYAVVQQRSLRCRAATAFYAVVQQRSPRCCSEQQRHRMPW
jgi:hypothetical protein